MYTRSLRIATSSAARAAVRRQPAIQRFISTAPPHQQSRSWKSSATRWGLAGALVYYYNTSSVFAEEPAYAIHAPPETACETPEVYPTIDTVAAERRAETQARQTAASSPTQTATVAAPDAAGAAPGSPEELEQEASQQGAFNEETGEINWDCPCLGGMADGPCGEQFKAAFSCFVYSKEEPKGVDCIEHFKGMQNCFREHPDVYGAELEDEEAADATMAVEVGDAQHEQAAMGGRDVDREAASMPSLRDMGSPQHGGGEKVNVHTEAAPEAEGVKAGRTERAQAAAQQVARDHGNATPESDSAVPKAAHDAR